MKRRKPTPTQYGKRVAENKVWRPVLRPSFQDLWEGWTVAKGKNRVSGESGNAMKP
jgi:hypothetical protein